ncbi:MAG: DnaJ domain-containing protein [Acidobacteriia bacterium]|nr:DnaJ domain-containing protein [Terriglobia bacterium]
MALKDYYQLLEIPPTAPADEVKRAFRVQIARYHPDKVQHLGKEFQDMAADRAAELTEAYRVLSDEGRRAEYDRARAVEAGAPPPPPAAAAAPASGAPRPAAPSATAPPPPPPPEAPPQPKGGQYKQERASRDEFVRKATMNRFSQALEAVGGDFTSAPLRGFDIALVPKSKMFSRSKHPRLLGRFVSVVDADAVADAWKGAGQWGAPANEDICVFLMGTSLAAAGELAKAIAEQRRKQRNLKVTVIPVDARVWDAHMPLDAPDFAKTLIARLKSGT